LGIRFSDLRIDASSLKEFADGSIKVSAQLTKTGVFTYHNPDGTPRREYRPASEVFSDSSRESFAGAPVTINHPTFADGSRLVSAKYWKGVAIGHLGDNVRQDGDFAVADLYVRDADAVARVKSGDLKGVSCGYRVDYDPTPGTAPDGTSYDGIQKNIQGNHLALLPRGIAPRGGEGCSLRLDSNDDEELPGYTSKDHMDLETLKAQVTALTGELAKARTDAAELPALRAALDAAKAQLAELTPARLDALVAERETLLVTAKAAGVEYAGKTSAQIKRAIVAKKTPSLAARVDAMSDDAVDAVLAVYVAEPHPSLGTALAPMLTPVDGVRADGVPDVSKLPKVSDLYAASVESARNAWKVSK
jgi:hypothetical protein